MLGGSPALGTLLQLLRLIRLVPSPEDLRDSTTSTKCLLKPTCLAGTPSQSRQWVMDVPTWGTRGPREPQLLLPAERHFELALLVLGTKRRGVQLRGLAGLRAQSSERLLSEADARKCAYDC